MINETREMTRTESPEQQAEYIFKAEGITKEFNGNFKLKVLSGLNLSIKKGEMIAVVGASGTGKTTLMHILGALDRPSSGTMLYHGKDIYNKNDHELSAFRNKVIGFVFQFHHLLPEFTALENVMIPGLIARQDRKTVERRSSDLLGEVGLAARTAHKVGELSGGEQQRVAIARAMVMKPELLLADEPTGNLDPKTGQKVFDLIRNMNRDFSLSTVMVTHNYDLAAQMDRCLSLADGKLHPASIT